MAKKSMVQKNERRTKLAKKYSAKRKALKETVMDKTLPIEERFTAQMKLNSLPRNSAQERVRNRCALSGRPRATYRKFKLGRVMFRELSNFGQIPGVTKSSW